MVLNDPAPKSARTAPDPEENDKEEEVDEEKRELEELETEVKQMAEKILEFRSSLPDVLKSTVVSLLSSQRPVAHLPAAGPEAGSSDALVLTEEEQNAAEKVRLLKERISSNVSAMPTVLKRLKECASRIDELDSFVGTIHPAFKRKRTS